MEGLKKVCEISDITEKGLSKEIEGKESRMKLKIYQLNGIIVVALKWGITRLFP